MRKKLSIVVTCTDGKTLDPAPGLEVRNLGTAQPAARRRRWARRVTMAPPPSVALRDLYRGQLWASSLHLEDAATDAGYAVDLYVASAGLGLRPVDSLGPGYAATFTPSQADSVAEDVRGARAWWAALKDLPGSLDLAELPTSKVMIVASDAYATAMHDDLVALGRRPRKSTIIFGGSTDIDGIQRVAANRDLRTELRGSIATVNTRSAARWITMDTDRDFWSEELDMRWQEWATSVEVSESHNRTRLTDAQVKTQIMDFLSRGLGLSASDALRALRESGFACEQKRFHALYHSVMVAS